MTTRFTRLSVVAGAQQIDVSLPAARPVVEYVGELPGLFGIPAATPPAAWVLSTPRTGVVRDDRTLEEVGILDGDLLYLSTRTEAARSPVVDDVLATVAADLDDRSPAWAGRARDTAVTALLAVAVAPLALVLDTLSPRAGGVALLVAFAVLAAAATVLRSRGGAVLGWTALVLALLGAYRFAHDAGTAIRVLAAAAALLAGAGLIAWVARLPLAVSIAGVVSGVLAGGASAVLAAGAHGPALAAWSSLGLVLILGILPQVSLSISGLVGLVRSAEDGAAPARSSVDRSVFVARSVVDGVTAALGLAGATAVATLVLAGRPSQAWLGGLIGLIFVLRSRGFSQAHQVAFLLAVPLVGLLAAALAAPRWGEVHSVNGAITLQAGGIAAVLVVAAVCGYTRLPEVTAARISRLLDRLDMFAVIAFVPVVLLAQGVFAAIARHA